MDKIRGKVGFQNCFSIRSMDKRGGLAMMWSDGTEFEIVNYYNYHIHAKIKGNPTDLGWFLTRFYRIPKAKKRMDFRNLLEKINPRSEASWCVLGDFNEITTQNKKMRGRLRPLNQMEAFKLALNSNGLLNLGWKGKKYTLSNRHSDDIYTMEMLDRAMANRNWVSFFGNLGVEVLTTSESDHHALLLSTTN